MPQKSSPPPVMTWAKAAPTLVVAIVFDALRLMFEWFVFFGPALAAIYCTAKVGDTAVIGGALTGACVAGATALGFVGSEVTIVFGLVMAMAIGLAGWLTIGIITLVTNGRVLRENFLWFFGSLVVSEVPFVNSLPAFTITTWRMYHRQIKTEKAAFKKWEEENKAAQLQERNQQAAQAAQMGQAQQAQAEQERTEQEQRGMAADEARQQAEEFAREDEEKSPEELSTYA